MPRTESWTPPIGTSNRRRLSPDPHHDNDDDRLLTPREVAELFGVRTTTMRRILKRNGVRFRRQGRGWEPHMTSDAEEDEDRWPPMPTRPAREGEVCSCGRPAVEVAIIEGLGPVPSCGTADEAHRPPDCPPWCVQDHDLSYELRHEGEAHAVRLDAHVWQQRIGGEWRTCFPPLIVCLAKEPGSKPAHIEIVGSYDLHAKRLTAYEAEQLAETLTGLAATLREPCGD